MNVFWTILTVVLIIAVIVLVVLYFLGRRLEKRQVESQAIMEAAAQTVSMLIIDKKDDVRTLRNLGAKDNQVVRIFLFEGRMISVFGALSGIVLGLLLCFLQQRFGLISLGGGNGSFVVDAYPVSVHATDIILVFLTVITVGFLSVWYPVRYLSKRLLRKR